MPYYPTIDEDLQRAEEILQNGRGNGSQEQIYQRDNYAAYRILQSLVDHARYLQRVEDGLLDTIRQFERAVWKMTVTTTHQQHRTADLRDTLRALQAPERLGPLPLDHPAVGRVCPGCSRLLQVGDHVALVTVGPGDDEKARLKAGLGLPYIAVAVPAHWSCVTGLDGQ